MSHDLGTQLHWSSKFEGRRRHNMCSRIIVKNLPKDITKEILAAHIKKACPATDITDCNLKFTSDGVFRKFAFVGFKTSDDASNAQKKLQGTFIRTTKIQADMAIDIGDAKIKVWSKYSRKDQGEMERSERAKTNDTKEETEQEEKPIRTGFGIKMKGLSGFYTEKTVREFFKPVKSAAVKILRTAQKKPIGVAFVHFTSQKDQEQAMGRNKNFMNGSKIFLKKSSDDGDEKSATHAPPLWLLKAKQQSTSQEVESIAESGRLFVRNIYFGVTEEELEALLGKYGPIAELNLPVDSVTKKSKGYAHVVFVFPEHALKAFTELDYTSLRGRLLHILPGKEKSTEDESNEMSSYKKKKDLQQKANSSRSHNWNALFLGANAVADAMAEKYNTDKSHILDADSHGSVGVRVALGETQIVAETREFLVSNGVALDCFSQAAGERSKTVILVKNLPSGVTTDTLEEVFGKHGTVARVVMPPTGITAIVEYLEQSEARKGFLKLNFSKFRSVPLYLEWAPMGVFNRPALSEAIKKESEKDDEERGDTNKEMKDDKTNDKNEDSDKDSDLPEEGSTVFVKNLNFATTDKQLKEHFINVGGEIHSATVAKKKDARKPGELLSMGYGFVEFMKPGQAKESVKQLQNSMLDGHHLELKISTRTSAQVRGRHKQDDIKQTTTKILVRNIPFEASKNEIQELFKVFGELKFVRLPKKLGGTGPHRGFAFVDFLTKPDAKRAFNALCHSTHLYGRRLVLEWAEGEETIEDLRRKTARYFSDDGPSRKKVKKSSIMKELE